ncbi:hypothetical protein VB711_20055 [Cronbergia sp. UHCC 0137]|uniref:hypothetical protein n=1 Tax=Cronbergia sp. UHCC 0137 TaxID=3110239 RepID=UPI002B1F0135|nr:hypothetical protein [Cronbergia sp. UHCC 0137]MEA5620120.1 hypothetical protein [Cronbergia sp. UHCC 0137]
MIISDLQYLEDTTQDIDADLQGGSFTFNINIGAIIIGSRVNNSIFIGQNSSLFTNFVRRWR